MGREFELKFAATAEVQTLIAEKYGEFERISMETTYFDTPERILSRLHVTLRRRMENNISVCTVKVGQADGSKGEWEVEWDDPTTMVQELCKQGAPQSLEIFTAGGIIPICGAKFTRLAKTLTLPNGSVELALDEGILLGGTRRMPLCEVEVELKSGPDQVAIDFAADLAQEFSLHPEKCSKFQRAKQLAEGE